MNLDIINDLFNNLKENKFVQNFIKELSNYFEKNNKNNLNFENKGIPIIEEILSKNNFTTANQNSIRWNLNDVISKYEQKHSSNDALYFIKEENSNSYNVILAHLWECVNRFREKSTLFLQKLKKIKKFTAEILR